MQRTRNPTHSCCIPAEGGNAARMGKCVLPGFLALHLLPQRHEAVGVECRTVEVVSSQISRYVPADALRGS